MLSSRSIHKFSNLAATAARFKFFSTALRSYPQYTVYGDNCMLSMRIMLPTLKCSRNNAIYVDGSKGVGRILLEWTPRASDGRGERDMTVRFALSPEEVGVITDQLPHHPVEFIRRMQSDQTMHDTSHNKLIRIAPLDNATFSFVFDYEKDGVTGVGPEGPYEVHLQLGEFVVLKELMRTSIPVLTGWSPLVESGMKHAVEQAIRESGGSSNDGYRDGPPGGLPF